MKKFVTIALAMIFLTITNAQKGGVDSRNHRLKSVIGIASIYSANLHHTKTSTGETYAHENLTGASNHFKLHTWVKVINMRNGKSVIVRINDHMNKKQAQRGRVIDVSRSAATILGFLSRGLTRVKLEEVIR